MRFVNTIHNMVYYYSFCYMTQLQISGYSLKVKLQGGILSPALFNIYMDGLSTSLNSSYIGGHIGGNRLNHLCYADDMCLISLSSAGVQRL